MGTGRWQADERIADHSGVLPLTIAQRHGDRHLERLLQDVEYTLGMHIGDQATSLDLDEGPDHLHLRPDPYAGDDDQVLLCLMMCLLGSALFHSPIDVSCCHAQADLGEDQDDDGYDGNGGDRMLHEQGHMSPWEPSLSSHPQQQQHQQQAYRSPLSFSMAMTTPPHESMTGEVSASAGRDTMTTDMLSWPRSVQPALGNHGMGSPSMHATPPGAGPQASWIHHAAAAAGGAHRGTTELDRMDADDGPIGSHPLDSQPALSLKATSVPTSSVYPASAHPRSGGSGAVLSLIHI